MPAPESPDEHPFPGRPTDARIRFTEALRDLLGAAVSRQASDVTYIELQHQVEAMIGQLEAEPSLDTGPPQFVTKILDPSSGAPGDDWSFNFPDSAFSGVVNPASPNMRVYQDGREAVGEVTCGRPFLGAPGRVHGGTVAGLIDDVMGALLPIIGQLAFTGELTVRYVAGCPIDTPLMIRARSTGQDGRKIFVEAEGTSAEGQFAVATGTFIAVETMATKPGLNGNGGGR